jgi:hypothetical protein
VHHGCQRLGASAKIQRATCPSAIASARGEQHPIGSGLERDLQEAGTGYHSKLETSRRTAGVQHVILGDGLQLVIDAEPDRVDTGEFRERHGSRHANISAVGHLAEADQRI